VIPFVAYLLFVFFLNIRRTNLCGLIGEQSANRLQLKVMDLLGRTIETKKEIPANTSFRIGSRLRPGTYFIELMQGKQRRIIGLIKE
jgi:hypothetical protein